MCSRRSVRADLPGRVDIAWLHSATRDFNDPSSTWVVSMAQSATALSSHPTFTTTGVSPGIVHAGDICQAGLFCTVTSGNRSLLDFIYMAIDARGLSHIVYANDLGALETVHAVQASGVTTLGTKL